ncbi:MAG: hypothetical protein MJ166_09885 [Clostridia bacterium]|nr:hypothetical protein [Clostridia bacterium]
MKMKKILAGVLSFTLALTMLCSCSSDNSKKGKSDKKDKKVEDVDDEDDDDSNKSDKKDHGSKGGSDIDPTAADMDEILSSNKYELVDTEFNGTFVDIVNSSIFGVLALTKEGDVVKIYPWDTKVVANIPDATGFVHQLNGSSAAFVETKSGELKCVIPDDEYAGDVVDVPKTENAVYYVASPDSVDCWNLMCYYITNGKLGLKVVDCLTGEVKVDSEIPVSSETVTSGYGDEYGVLMTLDDGSQCTPLIFNYKDDGTYDAMVSKFDYSGVNTNCIVGYYNGSYVWLNADKLEWGVFWERHSVELPEGFDAGQIEAYYVYGDGNDRGCFFMKNGDVWCMKSDRAPEINEFYTSISSHVVMISHEYILLDNGNIYTNH